MSIRTRGMVAAAVAVAAALGGLFEWPLSAGAALALWLLPIVAAVSDQRPVRRETDGAAPGPTRGLCGCGHVMSMHCHPDCSGPCAVPGCPCEGQGGAPAPVTASSAAADHPAATVGDARRRPP